MTSVRVTVNDSLLGDITVEHDDHVGSNIPERQQHAIHALITRAVYQINAAYDIKEIQ